MSLFRTQRLLLGSRRCFSSIGKIISRTDFLIQVKELQKQHRLNISRHLRQFESDVVKLGTFSLDVSNPEEDICNRVGAYYDLKQELITKFFDDSRVHNDQIYNLFSRYG